MMARTKASAALAVAAWLLGACGGGDSVDEAAPAPVPAPAPAPGPTPAPAPAPAPVEAKVITAGRNASWQPRYGRAVHVSEPITFSSIASVARELLPADMQSPDFSKINILHLEHRVADTGGHVAIESIEHHRDGYDIVHAEYCGATPGNDIAFTQYQIDATARPVVFQWTEREAAACKTQPPFTEGILTPTLVASGYVPGMMVTWHDPYTWIDAQPNYEALTADFAAQILPAHRTPDFSQQRLLLLRAWLMSDSLLLPPRPLRILKTESNADGDRHIIHIIYCLEQLEFVALAADGFALYSFPIPRGTIAVKNLYNSMRCPAS